MAEVRLHCGLIALVDDEDLPLVNARSWKAKHGPRTTYAYANTTVRRIGPGSRFKYISHLMHRLILGAPPGSTIDHINGNGLDNRRANLRLCNQTENNANKGPRRGRRSSKYKGVTLLPSGKWQAQIAAYRRKYHLGSFSNEEDAARAYDRAARKHFGEFAWTNFPDECPPRAPP